jgi:hypothetical protein
VVTLKRRQKFGRDVMKRKYKKFKRDALKRGTNVSARRGEEEVEMRVWARCADKETQVWARRAEDDMQVGTRRGRNALKEIYKLGHDRDNEANTSI